MNEAKDFGRIIGSLKDLLNKGQNSSMRNILATSKTNSVENLNNATKVNQSPFDFGFKLSENQ